MKESTKAELRNLFIKYLSKQKHINKLRTNLGLSIICTKIMLEDITADNVKTVLESLGYDSIKVNGNFYCFNINELSVKALERKSKSF